MKKLILVRHAKSSWGCNVADLDRPLKASGICDAHRLSDHILEEMPSFDALFTSPANRSLHTCVIFCRNLRVDFSKIIITNDLYDFSGNLVLDFLKTMNEELNTIMIFGHNQAFTCLVNHLGDRCIQHFSTSAVAGIQFNINSWQQITDQKGEVFIYKTPKTIK